MIEIIFCVAFLLQAAIVLVALDQAAHQRRMKEVWRKIAQDYREEQHETWKSCALLLEQNFELRHQVMARQYHREIAETN